MEIIKQLVALAEVESDPKVEEILREAAQVIYEQEEKLDGIKNNVLTHCAGLMSGVADILRGEE